MRKLLLGALLLLSTLSFSQGLEYKDKVLSFNSENSQGVEFTNRFNIESDVINKIGTTEAFCKWERTMEIEKYRDGSTSKLDFLKNKLKSNNFLIYIYQTIGDQNFMAGYKCKNPQSFKVIENSKGDIYINNKNELIITENYSAKNGYGNDIPGKLFIVIDLNTGKSQLLL